MNETTETSLWNKNANDLTVGDVVKINLVAVGICAAVPVAIWTASVATDKAKALKNRIKNRKPELTIVEK